MVLNKYFRFIVIVVLAFVLLLYGAWQLSRSTSYQTFGKLVSQVDTEHKVVALTFDDGPMPGKTEAVLQALADANVPATFFLVGEAIHANMPQAKLIADAGHEIGNHSYTHNRMVLTPPTVVAKEIEQTNRLIHKTGYRGEIHFRPPYGKKLFSLPYYLDQSNVTTVTWNIAPEGALGRKASAEQLSGYVAKNVTPGSVILLHIMFDSRANSLSSVPMIVARLRQQGYRFVTISELLAIQS
jgi:peptidoglycan-N-acetylglucosamine deacetylase